MRCTVSLVSLLIAAPLSAQVSPPTPPTPPAPARAPQPSPAPKATPAPRPMPPDWPAPPMPALAPFDVHVDVDVGDVRVKPFIADFKYDYDYNYDYKVEVPRAFAFDNAIASMRSDFASVRPGFYDFSSTPRQSWAPQDPADSAWRQARETLSRGDYRRAAGLFKDLVQKNPNSVYAPDALYYQAFALYRIGGSTELQEALAVLDVRKTKYPAGRGSRGDNDPGLSTRIAGVLASRGMGDRELVKRALAEGGGAASCDNEEQSVRSEALGALRQTDPDQALTLAKSILGKKDDCSTQLRRTALWLIANKRDASATATIAAAAKSDPSSDVRSEATRFLASMPGDDALAALEELAKSDDERVQREAVRALTTHSSPRARQAMRTLVEKNDTPEQLRLTALDAFDRDRSTMDDATWLRTIYPKVDNARVRARIVSAVGRIGGEANEQWIFTLAKDENESTDVRQNALRYVTQTADIASLGKFYDAASARPLREEIVNALGNRKEPEATDKLIDIIKTGTDPQIKRSAINALARKKDPRSTKLLVDLISK
jgi:HEAT repeat protein